MEQLETLKFLADYGVAVLVLVGVIYWLAKTLNHKVDANTAKVDANTKSLDTLTQAITALTNSMASLYKTSEKAFEDNRRTIDVLIEHIETGKKEK